MVDRLALPQVTLLAATSVAREATLRAMHTTMRQIDFGAVHFLSDREPESITDHSVPWNRIKPMRSRGDYSQFLLREIGNFVETSHVLVVQWDGYVLDARSWDTRFLDYDYVGAPWPQFADSYRVGNGGFSLRSRRLIDALLDFPDCDQLSEDVAICRHWRAELEATYRIKFAPENLARRFSFERLPRQGNEFGFHGAFHLPDILGRDDFHALLRSIEKGVLGKRERAELLGRAWRHHDWSTAMLILAHRIAWPGARIQIPLEKAGAVSE